MVAPPARPSRLERSLKTVHAFSFEGRASGTVQSPVWLSCASTFSCWQFHLLDSRLFLLKASFPFLLFEQCQGEADRTQQVQRGGALRSNLGWSEDGPHEISLISSLTVT